MVIGMNSSKALGPENAHLLGEFLKLHFLSYKSSDSEMFDMWLSAASHVGEEERETDSTVTVS